MPNDEKQNRQEERKGEREVFSLFLLRKNKTSVFVMKQDTTIHSFLFPLSLSLSLNKEQMLLL